MRTCARRRLVPEERLDDRRHVAAGHRFDHDVARADPAGEEVVDRLEEVGTDRGAGDLGWLR
jgi:hypothetical protein